MPKKLEIKLRKTARDRGYSGERTERYVYGTLQRITDSAKRKGSQGGKKS